MIKPAKLENVDTPRKRSPRQADVMEFHNSDMDACEVILGPGERPESISTSYRNAIVRLGIHTIRVRTSGDHIYLIKINGEKA